jgi:hypothetical protein
VHARDRKDMGDLVPRERIGLVDSFITLTQIPAESQRWVRG